MKVHGGMSLRAALPLPAFVLHPLTAAGIAVMHVYLAAGHLLIGGEVTWTNVWKGFGALAGAYLFAALASRGRVKRRGQDQRMPEDEPTQLST
ncbi:MAG: hypothetical protein WA741_08745 [Candidatus Sulfotelmatobacter sp.]